MRKLFFFLLFLVVTVAGFGQNKSSSKKQVSKKQSLAAILNGQWKGSFGSNGDIVIDGGADNTEYVLELDIQGTTVTGYSYSYFQDRAFYVICSLEGTLNLATQTVTVTETARLKGTTPQGGDCFQTHILTYKKEGDLEELTGRWKTAPGQLGDCGFGKTTLIRKTLSSNLASYNKKTTSNTPFSPTKPATKKTELVEKNKTKAPVVKDNPVTTAPVIVQAPLAANPVTKDTPPVVIQTVPEKQQDIPIASDINYEKRNTNLLQTITIENPTIRVTLYDNGVVDGDSISLFYNNKLILSHQRLSENPITLTLNVNTNKQVNDLTMYAENLGEIPPNTALMVVTDGDKRYEIPVTSDLKNSGTVRFVFSGDK